MIKSFKHKGLKSFFETGSLAGIQAKHAKKLQTQLTTLNKAEDIAEMDFPN
jgi:proteic killer suppression protein